MITARFALFVVLSTFAACSGNESTAPSGSEEATADDSPVEEQHDGSPRAPEPPEGKAVALFAGGCFWCMERPFEVLDGVESVLSGYTDGNTQHPTYEEVSSGDTGHSEAIRVLYDPAVIRYETLLETFWHNVDPTDAGGQFCDRGNQYRTGIYPVDAEQRAAAEASKAAIAEELGERIVTPITDATTFWVAEDYHQNYYQTHPIRYRQYRTGCGRDRRLVELWGGSGH
ncbi:MAG: peptide-methionine (S)-S-oxide reductase MsrA [Deltaproteobacteria bacterium]|nr:peptide-methionine (S)-S-oxide reductase MsrA [Deltaproteobacteria bacterium]